MVDICMVKRGSKRFYRLADEPRDEADAAVCSGIQSTRQADNSVSNYRECPNKAQVERGDKWWCHEHDPEWLEKVYGNGRTA